MKEGDYRKAYSLIVDIVPDKLTMVDLDYTATLEIEIQEEYFLGRILVKEGETVSIDDPIAILCEESSDVAECHNVKVPRFI